MKIADFFMCNSRTSIICGLKIKGKSGKIIAYEGECTKINEVKIMSRKKATGICIAALITMFSAMGANAQTPVDLKVNEKIIKLDANAYIDNGTALVPLRRVSEALGCESVEWSDKNKSASVKDANGEVTVYANSKKAQINSKTVTMPKSAKLVGGKLYVGARFLGEALGADVKWNTKTHTVELTKNNHTVTEEYIEDAYTSDDLDWLAKIVHAEAQGEIHNGKIAVANVIMNRIKSDLFPNSVYDVVFDRKYGVQFTPVANGAIYNNASNDSYRAAKQALYGANTAGESLYFCNPKTSTNFWIINNRKLFGRIGNHDFYL